MQRENEVVSKIKRLRRDVVFVIINCFFISSLNRIAKVFRLMERVLVLILFFFGGGGLVLNFHCDLKRLSPMTRFQSFPLLYALDSWIGRRAGVIIVAMMMTQHEPDRHFT